MAMLVACAKEATTPSPAPAPDAPPLAAPAAPAPEGATTATIAVATPPPSTVAAAIDAGAPQLPAVPPAGRAPCSGRGAKDARGAALACFASRVRPALLDLAKNPNVGDYRFGEGDYLRMVMSLSPRAGAPQPWQNGTPKPPFPNLVALGSPDEVKAPRTFVVVTVSMQGKAMPADGGMELDFFVDARTFETVLVLRVLGG